MQQQLQQRIAIALASREDANALKNIVAGKKKTPEQTAKFGLGRRARKFAEVIENASLGIEFLILILREVVELDIMAELVFTGAQRLGLSQQFNKRRLPRPVDSDQSNALAPFDDEIYVSEYFVIAITLG